jgi:hypothetical protein
LKPPVGYEWKEKEWRVEITNQTDAEGFQYAHGWHLLNKRCQLQVTDSFLMNVRRRKWIRSLVLRSGELAQYGHLSHLTTFVPFELMLTIKRADLQGFTSATYVEVYLDGRLIDKTSNGPSEWNKMIVVPFFDLPNEQTKVTCLVKSDALLDKLHPDLRIKGEALIDIADILSTQTIFSSSTLMLMFEKDYSFRNPYAGKLTVGINFVEHRLFRIEVESQSDSGPSIDSDQSKELTARDDKERRENFTAMMEDLAHAHFDPTVWHKLPKLLSQLKSLVKMSKASDESFIVDAIMDVVCLLREHQRLLPSLAQSNSGNSNRQMERIPNSGAYALSSQWKYSAISITNESLLHSNPVLMDTIINRASALNANNHQKLRRSILNADNYLMRTSECCLTFYLSFSRSLEDSNASQRANEDYQYFNLYLPSERHLVLLLRALAQVFDDNFQGDENALLFHVSDARFGWQKNIEEGLMFAGSADLLFDLQQGEWMLHCHRNNEEQASETIPLAAVAALEADGILGLPCSHLLHVSLTSVEDATNKLKGSFKLSLIDMMAIIPSSDCPSASEFRLKLPSGEDITSLDLAVDRDWLVYCAEQIHVSTPVLVIQLRDEIDKEHSFSGLGAVTAIDLIQAAKQGFSPLPVDIYPHHSLRDLHMHIKSASKLIGVDINGTSDPYFIVYLTNANAEVISIPKHLLSLLSPKSKSRIFNAPRRPSTSTHLSEYQLAADCLLFVSEVISGTCNPIWNATVKIPSELLIRGRWIVIEAWDANRLTSHTCLGSYKTSIDFAAMLDLSSTRSISEEMLVEIAASKKTPKKFLVSNASFGRISLQTQYLPHEDMESKSSSSPSQSIKFSMQVSNKTLAARECFWPCSILGTGLVAMTANADDSSLRHDPCAIDQTKMHLHCGDLHELVISCSDRSPSMDSSFSIIEECVEYSSSTNQIKIPWDQLRSRSLSLLSPINAVVCDLILHRRLPGDRDNIREISVSLLIGPCLAHEVYHLFVERSSLYHLRSRIEISRIPASLNVSFS